ncbi:MAG: acylphosphatase [Candidatus Bathyarchaeum tardum]|nr:MAG: acylphosphatase [Candidatus Bathyarchaeum tardum]
MNIRAHIFVTGKVQGVFFRASTRSEAIKQNVIGWVRNVSDGRVEAIFEGKKENVEKMIDFCRVGPSGAHILRTDVRWGKYVGDFSEFKIKKDLVL